MSTWSYGKWRQDLQQSYSLYDTSFPSRALNEQTIGIRTLNRINFGHYSFEMHINVRQEALIDHG